jgi:hypothetical protein
MDDFERARRSGESLALALLKRTMRGRALLDPERPLRTKSDKQAIPYNTTPGDMGPNSLPLCPEKPASSQCGDVRSEVPEGRPEAVRCGGATKALPSDLLQIAAAWPELPQETRDAILAMVKATPDP